LNTSLIQEKEQRQELELTIAKLERELADAKDELGTIQLYNQSLFSQMKETTSEAVATTHSLTSNLESFKSELITCQTNNDGYVLQIHSLMTRLDAIRSLEGRKCFWV
jgi:chromosome segregation ATPase